MSSERVAEAGVRAVDAVDAHEKKEDGQEDGQEDDEDEDDEPAGDGEDREDVGGMEDKEGEEKRSSGASGGSLLLPVASGRVPVSLGHVKKWANYIKTRHYCCRTKTLVAPLSVRSPIGF